MCIPFFSDRYPYYVMGQNSKDEDKPNPGCLGFSKFWGAGFSKWRFPLCSLLKQAQQGHPQNARMNCEFLNFKPGFPVAGFPHSFLCGLMCSPSFVGFRSRGPSWALQSDANKLPVRRSSGKTFGRSFRTSTSSPWHPPASRRREARMAKKAKHPKRIRCLSGGKTGEPA